MDEHAPPVYLRYNKELETMLHCEEKELRKVACGVIPEPLLCFFLISLICFLLLYLNFPMDRAEISL